MDKINLNFFGEKVAIDTPKDLQLLKSIISEKYCISPSDVEEIILFYVKDSNKIYIINGNDFSKYIESKIPTIFLDVNQNSKLYQDNISQIKNEIKEENKQEEKKEEIDIEKAKKEIEKLTLEKERILKNEKEKNKLYNDKISVVIKQIVELEKLKEELSMECALDLSEFREQRNEIDKKIEEIKKKIEPPKKEEVILKDAPKPAKSGGYWIRSGQNNFPYSKEALKKNFENQRKYQEKFKAAKEKRMKERKAQEEKKALEAKKEVNLKDIKMEIPEAIPVFIKVNEVLNKTVEKVKLFAKEKIMTKEEKDVAKKEEEVKKEKERHKKEQIDKIKKITKDAVKEINDLTKMVIEQSNSLINIINNPQLYKSSSSDDILLRAVPKIQKKEKQEIHFHVICDGCKEEPLKGIRYKCKKCDNLDFCEDCYKKNKESHGHDFIKIEHPRCRNRLGHPNKDYLNRGIIHSKVMCDGCGMLPISGWRYKCILCDDYNLCENCEERIGRKHWHPFLKLTSSVHIREFNENYFKLNCYDQNK